MGNYKCIIAYVETIMYDLRTHVDYLRVYNPIIQHKMTSHLFLWEIVTENYY